MKTQIEDGPAPITGAEAAELIGTEIVAWGDPLTAEEEALLHRMAQDAGRRHPGRLEARLRLHRACRHRRACRVRQ